MSKYRVELYKLGCRCLPKILSDGFFTIYEARQYIKEYIAKEYSQDVITQTIREYPGFGTRKETTSVNFGKRKIENEHRLTIYEDTRER